MLKVIESFSLFMNRCLLRRRANMMHSGFWCGYGVDVGDEVQRCNSSVSFVGRCKKCSPFLSK